MAQRLVCARLEPDEIGVIGIAVGIDMDHDVTDAGFGVENLLFNTRCNLVRMAHGHLGVHVKFEVDDDELARAAASEAAEIARPQALSKPSAVSASDFPK